MYFCKVADKFLKLFVYYYLKNIFIAHETIVDAYVFFFRISRFMEFERVLVMLIIMLFNVWRGRLESISNPDSKRVTFSSCF